MQSFQYTKYKNHQETLAEFLAKKFPYRNYEGWFEQISLERILINGKPAKPQKILNTCDIISYITLREEEPPVDCTFDILHEDQWLLGVSKSGNIPVTRSGKYVFNNLLNTIKEQCKIDELYAVQRLDRETSGVVIFAKTKIAAVKMTEIISGSWHQKKYHAVLKGIPSQSLCTVDAPIAKNPNKTKIRIRQMVTESGKTAKTHFKFIDHNDFLTLAEIETFTGRTHQIRVHADYIGMPIIGDKLYGADDQEFLSYIKNEKIFELQETGKISRQLLHATKLKFIHPFKDEEVILNSDYYRYFEKFPKIKLFLDQIPNDTPNRNPICH